jgi:hypothetical protein
MTDMTPDTALYIEEKLLYALKTLLSERVNELLAEAEDPIPPIETGSCRDGFPPAGICRPGIALSSGERTEKERIIRLEAYTLTLTFTLPEQPQGERYGYAYVAAVDTALQEDPTLGGVADWAELTGKKYVPPQQSGTGGDWTVVVTLRVTVAETSL